MYLKKIALFVILTSITTLLCGQNKIIVFHGIEEFKFSYPKLVKSKQEASKVGKQILKQLYNQSYLTATIDSMRENEDSVHFYVESGKEIRWAKLNTDHINSNELNGFDYTSKLYWDEKFSIKQFNKLIDKILKHYENTGYPFVSVALDSVKFTSDNSIEANLTIQKNRFYKIDSLIIEGNSQINKNYVQLYLNLQEGDAYNEFYIQNIESRLREIPFIQLKKRPEIQFFEEGVKIILAIDDKNASRFDGILGLLTDENSGKIELTGDVDLNLMNAFNRGESLGFNWRKLKGNSQDLQIDFEFPFIFKSPFGTEFNFELFKRDTTFLDLTTHLGINYLLERGEKVSLFIENKSSTILSKSSFISQNINGRPTLGDVKIQSFGVQYQKNNTDYLYNPTKGLQTKLSFMAGRKKLKKINAFEEENPNFYEGIKLTTNQYLAELTLNYFLKINAKNTVKFGSQMASINSELIYTNELLRIGGLKILRGFDEESINASTYTVFTLEYRFLLDQNSYFSLFYDKAFYENNSIDTYLKDDPYGVGAGISFETNSGIFTFNYAVGKQFNNPIQFRAAKIHFGFINFF